MTVTKPHLKLVDGEPVPIDQVEPPMKPRVAAARQRYGKPFGRVIWQKGEGPTFFTIDRLHALASENEATRKRRK